MSSNQRAILWGGALFTALAAVVLGLSIGAVAIPPGRAVAHAFDFLPGIPDGGLTETEATIVDELRLPRVVLGLVVGSMLSLCGCAYQGVFRNPLADPYLLGAAAGAGLGATLAIGWGLGGALSQSAGFLSTVPLFAFVGALGAVAIAYALGASGERARAPAALLLAGVAVAAIATAAQTFFQQRYTETIREVYSWILGRLSTAGWAEVVLVLPYATVAAVLILMHRRALDVMAVGDDEAASLGLRVDRTRLIIVIAASLGTAAAVAVSGLIGFVGIIVPHTIRLFGVTSYRLLLPLSMVVGGAFLVVADVVARQALAPAEIPLGVVTALAAAPFFLALLRPGRTQLS